MQLRRIVTGIAALAFAGSAAHAGEPGDGQTILTTKAATYVQIDSGGIEEVDEDGFVLEAIVFLDHDLGLTDRVSAKVLVDVVSSASITRDHNKNYRALQSGASGVTRVTGTLGWMHRFGDIDLSLHGSAAAEYAYTSFGGGATVSARLFEKNTTLSLGVDAYFDSVRMIRFNGDDEADEAKNSVTASLAWTQILSPLSLLNATAAYTRQDGFLAGQFNSVFTDDAGEDFEITPDARDRYSLTARYKHAVGSYDAIEFGGRVYNDSWGILGGTTDLRYFLHASPEHLFELTYRFHRQGGADFYKPHFTTAQTLQTSDPDLGDFNGHMVGVHYRLLDLEKPGPADEFDIGLYGYLRDNGLTMVWLSLGFSWDLAEVWK
ncbi:MAG: hypothetical protein ACI9MR_003707 [Myxococcota bacterium]|jgi:hypothetical protein